MSPKTKPKKVDTKRQIENETELTDKRIKLLEAAKDFFGGDVKELLAKNLGHFGTKGDKSTGESEASEWREKVKEYVERINEELKDVMDRAEFIRKINEEIKKLR
jgi:hypothetical protein